MIRQSLLFLLLAGTAAPALAQSIDQRVDRVERELRAVQRKVFPGGAPAYSEPEIAAPAAAAPPPIDAASGSPLNALTSRVDSLERSLEQLTGQVEQANHRLQIVSEQAAKDRAEFDGRLKSLEAAAAPPPATAPVAADDQPLSTPAPAPTRGKAGRGAPPKAFTIPPSAAAPTDDAAPASSSSASTATSSGDPAEDAYMAAYKLWDAKDYAGAEAALKKVVSKYPRSRRASYAQNLLGRAYLDDGQPASAAEAFAANYQRDPKGERAPDSLYYLGQSLMQLKKPADACRVYDELDSAYGSTLSTSLKSREATARREAKCAK